MNSFKRLNEFYGSFGRTIGAYFAAPSKGQIQMTLFVVGALILTSGVTLDAMAQIGGIGEDPGEYNDSRISRAVERIFTYLEGSFGVLVMVAAGLGAILSSAFGQYRAALGCLVVAVGAFILRSFTATFFNTTNIEGFDGGF